MSEYCPCWLVRWWQRLTSPIQQDPFAVLYGSYRGHVIMLRPLMSTVRPWMVEKWINDPDQERVVDQIIADEEKKWQREESKEDHEDDGEPPELPDNSRTPDGFNPADSTVL